MESTLTRLGLSSHAICVANSRGLRKTETGWFGFAQFKLALLPHLIKLTSFLLSPLHTSTSVPACVQKRHRRRRHTPSALLRKNRATLASSTSPQAPQSSSPTITRRSSPRPTLQSGYHYPQFF